jgi:hypothetical protein
MSDVDIWNASVPNGLDATMWPFILLTILWRLWDDRNGEKYSGMKCPAVVLFYLEFVMICRSGVNA